MFDLLFDLFMGYVAKLADFMLENIKFSIVVCGSIFTLILLIVIVGSYRPTYSRWYKIAQNLNMFANVMYWVLIPLGLLEFTWIVLKLKEFFYK